MENSETEKSKTVVLTGGTGSFGHLLVREVLKDESVYLVLLVRANSNEEAFDRVRKNIEGYEDRVKVLASDLTEDNLSLSENEYAELADRTTHILHSAASVRFALPLEKARSFNVKTTERMLVFAERCRSLERFAFVGTALVAGNRSGLITEDEFEHNAGFKNTYEQSKYEAEKLVRSYEKKFPLVIFRPPLVAPASSGSENSPKHMNALLLGANLVADGYVTFLPGTEESTVDIIDPQIAAKAISDLSFKPKLRYLVYHITNADLAPRVKDIVTIMERKLDCSFSLDFCGSMTEYNKRVDSIPWYHFKSRYAHRKIESFIPELAYPKIYANNHTKEELGTSHLDPDPTVLLEKLIGA